jgi:hypothetical protein
MREETKQVVNDIGDQKRSFACNPYIVGYEGLIVLTGNQLRQDLRNWLSPPDPSVNYNIACRAHHEGTALWFTKGNTFTDWKASGSLLWVHGKRTISWPLHPRSR